MSLIKTRETQIGLLQIIPRGYNWIFNRKYYETKGKIYIDILLEMYIEVWNRTIFSWHYAFNATKLYYKWIHGDT